MDTMRFAAATLSVGFSSADVLPLIPQPVSQKEGEGTFEFSAATAYGSARRSNRMQIFSPPIWRNSPDNGHPWLETNCG